MNRPAIEERILGLENELLRGRQRLTELNAESRETESKMDAIGGAILDCRFWLEQVAPPPGDQPVPKVIDLEAASEEFGIKIVADEADKKEISDE